MPVAVQRSDTPEYPEEEQEAFFLASLARTQTAEARVEVIHERIELAGSIIALEFAGVVMRDMLFPPLAHLSLAASGDADVTLHVWDSVSTGVAMLPAPCDKDHFTTRGDIWGMTSARFRAAWHYHDFSLNLLDVVTGDGVYWTHDAAKLPHWSRSSPLRTLLHWWMREKGKQLIHAAAVGTPNGALLMPGPGGVGKTTTSLACLEHGLRFLGDDYVVVELDPQPRVYSLYCSAKVTEHALARLPLLAPEARSQGVDEKLVLDLREGHGAQMERSLPIAAIALPRVVEQPATRFAAVRPNALVRAFEFTTSEQLPHAGFELAELTREMVAKLPGYELHLGTDAAMVAPAVAEALRMLPRAGAPAALPKLPVTVIIPVHNGTQFLPEAIDSILAQEFDTVEIVVVDDGSAEDVKAAVGALRVPVRYERQANAGAAAARNRGIAAASHETIAFLDVDDLWPPGSLSMLAGELLANPGVDVARGLAQPMRLSAEGRMTFLGGPRDAFPSYIGACLYRRRAFRRVGLFDASLRFSEDDDWFRRAVEHELPMIRLDAVTLLVRRHPGNSTKDLSMVQLQALRVMKMALERQRTTRLPGVR
ncbi:MAG: hypothetical protein JWO05_1300 [Gemmatimonadetes bacterium]|nr:hypothetical protein [Gemmatimonadota bacterium]